MMKEPDVLKFLTFWTAYETAKEVRMKAEEDNSREQQDQIEPLFQKAFPDLAEQGITYEESWRLGKTRTEAEIWVYKIRAWEESAGIDNLCAQIVNKNIDKIKMFGRSEKYAQIDALNAVLDMLERDANDELTPEQIQHFRKKVNAADWTYERQKFTEFIQQFVDKKRKG